MNIFDSITGLISQAQDQPEGYVKDGLIHCPNCNTPSQTVVTNPVNGKTSTVGCLCACRKAALDAQEAARHRQEQERRQRARKAAAFDQSDYAGCVFEADDGSNPEIADKMLKYAERFDRFLDRGHGLLLYGDVGTGKTWFSAAIANRLLEGGYKVLMTNFPTLVAKIQEQGFRSDLVASLGRYDLLIIDDLGVERSSEYMQEQVYSIIDARYRARKPLIVSTNLTSEELKRPKDIMAARIYGRILECCLPIRFEGKDKRKQYACHREMLEALK